MSFIITCVGAKSSYFGVRSGPINIYGLECMGTENSFTECASRPIASNCSHPDVGVFCTGNLPLRQSHIMFDIDCKSIHNFICIVASSNAFDKFSAA